MKRRSLPPGVRRLVGVDVPRASTIAHDLEDELRFHIEERAAQLERAGYAPDEALRRAREQYGSLEKAAQDISRYAHRRHHHMTLRHFIDTVWQDLRFALRTLARQPGWTAIAVIALALGIGANAAVFSVVNTLLIDPLRYPHRDRVVLITRTNAKMGLTISPSLDNLKLWSRARSFDEMHGVNTDDAIETSAGDPRTVRIARTDAGFFQFAGARIVIGRSLRADETGASGAPVALLSDHLWRERFNASPDALGKTLKIDGTIVTVVGVIDDALRLPSYTNDLPDVWLPSSASASFLGPIAARLREGVTMAAAQAELDAITRADEATQAQKGGLSLTPLVFAPGSTGQQRRSVLMLAGAVALLLLIACANVAHLLLARGASREREIAVRAAIGAGRGRIVRQLVTESLLLAAGGCVAGLLVAMGGLRLIAALRPESMSSLRTVAIDGRVLLVTITLSVATGLVFGVLSAMDGLRASSATALRAAGDASTDRRRHRLRSVLVVSEMALSVILLVGAVLLVRTMINLHRVDPGFDTSGLYSVAITLPSTRYPKEADRQAYAERLLDAAQKMPELRDATIASGAPPRVGISVGHWEAELGGSNDAASGSTAKNDTKNDITATLTVRPEYFALMRTPFIAGTTFDETSSDRGEVVISESLARQLWRTTSVVGRRLRMARSLGTQTADWMTVRGIVKDAAMLGLVEDRRSPGLYQSSRRVAGYTGVTLIVRSPDGLPPASAVRRLQLEIDPTLPPRPALPIADLLMRTVATQRFIMTLLTVFAGIAIALSAIGLYGVIAYMVRQRTREIGVRIALGATGRDIGRLVLSHGVRLATVGLLFGVVGAVLGGRAIRGVLYGVTPADPVSFLLGAIGLLVVAAVACLAPMLRAVRIDPVLAMRAD